MMDMWSCFYWLYSQSYLQNFSIQWSIPLQKKFLWWRHNFSKVFLARNIFALFFTQLFFSYLSFVLLVLIKHLNKSELIKYQNTAWKVSKYGVFSGLYFPVFRLNTGIYSVNLRIQAEYRKIRTRKNSVFGHFSRSRTSAETGRYS